jgi:hypothetical protein
MDNMKSIKKNWLASLSFLDNNIIYSVIVVILVLYSSTIFDNINAFVGNIFNFSLLKLLGLVLIIYVAPKDTTVAILLAVSYVISVYYMVNNETFVSDKNHKDSNIANIHNLNTHLANAHNANVQNKKIEKYSNSPVEPEHESYKNVPEKKHMNQNKKVEHFFPADSSSTGNAFDIRLKNTNVDTKQTDYANKNQPVKINQSCLSTYTPDFETLSDPCVPTATFQNEFNAQGLNFPEGFNSPVVGSPL